MPSYLQRLFCGCNVVIDFQLRLQLSGGIGTESRFLSGVERVGSVRGGKGRFCQGWKGWVLSGVERVGFCQGWKG